MNRGAAIDREHVSALFVMRFSEVHHKAHDDGSKIQD
jgi:hypothetical protein